MKSMGGNNALLFACGSTNISDDGILDYLIDQAGSDPNSMNDLHQNCLLMSTKKKQIKMLKEVLDKGACLGYTDKNKRNCLHIAAKQNDYKIVELILKTWMIKKRNKKCESVGMNHHPDDAAEFHINNGDIH